MILKEVRTPWPSELEFAALELIQLSEHNAAAFAVMRIEFANHKNYAIVPALIDSVINRTDRLIELCQKMLEAVDEIGIKPTTRPAAWYRLIDSDIPKYLRTLGGQPPKRPLEYKMYMLYDAIKEDYRRNLIKGLTEAIDIAYDKWQRLNLMILAIPFEKDSSVDYPGITKRTPREKPKKDDESDIDAPPPQAWSFVW